MILYLIKKHYQYFSKYSTRYILKSKDGKRPMLVHNIGSGQVLEDCLLNWKIVGHFRYHKE